MYNIHMGIPEMAVFGQCLCEKVNSAAAGKDEVKLHKKIGKALYLLSQNPRHPGLESHEIASLSKRYGMKVWQSYLENRTPAAGRIFWVYGPSQGEITIIGIEPHPNDKSNAYAKVTLSSMGDIIK